MEIEKLDRHKQNFRIKPNVQLHKHFHDWSDRIKVHVEGLEMDKDFKVMMFVVSNFFFLKTLLKLFRE